MIPREYFASSEIVASNNSYVIALESNPGPAERNTISVKITDAAMLLMGKIENEEIVRISEKLGLTDEKLAECLRKAVRARTPVFHENEKRVKLFLINGTKTSQVTIQLEAVNETAEKSLELKNLILRMTRHIKVVEDVTENTNKLHAFDSGFGNHILGAHPHGKKPPKAKRTNPGMSIVNPTSKRSKSKPGVDFNQGSSDESE